jgi:putative Flp pilus-assembly TadE/G-like protein
VTRGSHAHPAGMGSLRSKQGDRGQVVVLLVLVLVVLLGIAALTIDLGRAYYAKRSLQASADAAALAGAQGLPNSASAQSLARQYSGSPGAKNERLNVPNVATSVTVKCVSSVSTCSTANTVVVSERSQVGSIFARVLGIRSFDIGAKSTACSPWPGFAELIDESSGYCPVNPGPCVIGYPFSSSNSRTSVDFNESEVLRAFAPQMAGPGDTIKVWYNDEHALTLGVRQLAVVSGTKKKPTTTTTNYPIAALTSNPGGAFNPAVGSRATSGDAAAVDPVDRPMFPALFVTDLTNDPTSKAGDWQYGGTPISPNAVFGTWKGAVRTVDKTKNPATVSVTPDADPAKNNWSLGGGSDNPPSGLKNEGYGAEARWNVSDLGLQPGHAYRLQFMVHDGDQHQTGGDSGENCMTVVIPR